LKNGHRGENRNEEGRDQNSSFFEGWGGTSAQKTGLLKEEEINQSRKTGLEGRINIKNPKKIR